MTVCCFLKLFQALSMFETENKLRLATFFFSTKIKHQTFYIQNTPASVTGLQISVIVVILVYYYSIYLYFQIAL